MANIDFEALQVSPCFLVRQTVPMPKSKGDYLQWHFSVFAADEAEAVNCVRQNEQYRLDHRIAVLARLH